MPPHDRARLVHREGRRVQHDDVARGLGRPRADAGAAQAEASLDGQAVYQRVLASWSQLPADDVVVPRRRARRHEPHGLAGADPGRAAADGHTVQEDAGSKRRVAGARDLGRRGARGREGFPEPVPGE